MDITDALYLLPEGLGQVEEIQQKLEDRDPRMNRIISAQASNLSGLPSTVRVALIDALTLDEWRYSGLRVAPGLSTEQRYNLALDLKSDSVRRLAAHYISGLNSAQANSLYNLFPDTKPSELISDFRSDTLHYFKNHR